MSPQQAIREKGKSFPWAVDWLQRHSEKATATGGRQRQWRIQAARLCHPPTTPVRGDSSLGSTASAGGPHHCPPSLGATLGIWLPEVPARGGRTCYCSLARGGFDWVFSALASSIAWHTLRHPHTAVRYDAAPTGDLCLSEVAAEAGQECPRAPQMTRSAFAMLRACRSEP